MAVDQASTWWKRTLPQTVDDLAQEKPDRDFGYWHRQDEVQSIALSWWLIGQLGHSRQSDVLTYVGPNDVRYPVLVLAPIMTGFKLFLTSPRNSSVAHRKMFGALNCSTLVTPYPYQRTAQAFVESSFSDALFIIHTSESTGIPKPLTWTQGTAVRFIEEANREPPIGTSSIKKVFHGNRESTADGVVNALRKTPAYMAFLAPSTVDELAKSPHSFYTRGGDLPQAIGDIIVASGISLCCCWGASEVGIPQHLILLELEKSLGDWHYISFHPDAGASFHKVDDDGLYELVIRRDESIIDTQTTFTIEGLEKLTEYRTHDLFEQHPTAPNAWRWHARADDMIVFLNGEKTTPISLEQSIVATNPQIMKGAILVGAQRSQAALLVDPIHQELTAAGRDFVIERLWPSIEEANKRAPAHARVEKSMVMTKTVQRAATVELFAAEVDMFYESVETCHDAEATTAQIRNAVHDITDLDITSESQNVFEFGMDSLHALRLTRMNRTVLNYLNLSLSTIYRNPTPKLLAIFILSHSVASNIADELHENNLLDNLLSFYQGQIREMTTIPRLSLSRDNHDRFTAAHLDVTALDERVTFLHASQGEPRLGLCRETYSMLGARVGLVVHYAWAVNFNFNLLMFRTLLAGLVKLFQSASDATTSNICTILISNTSLSRGYARSKLLAKLLCDSAAQHLVILIAVLRVGQIAGSTTQHGTIWNPAEWIPSLVISSARTLNCLPDSLDTRFSEIDLVPANLLGAVVADLALANSKDGPAPRAGAAVFNFARVIRSEKGGTNEGCMANTMLLDAAIDNPAIKLVDFYRRGIRTQKPDHNGAAQVLMVINHSMAVSDSLRAMPIISSEWMGKWVEDWLES
ncbi:putative NRPS-like enzyme [Xylariaceae sp. FL1272]|nr:putative NRPS-like enzyme [Xylariaceae sp. FL1272]